MSPKRLVTPAWWHRHGAVVGYVILAAGVAFALAGVYHNARDTSRATRNTAIALAKTTRDNAQRVTRSQCLAARDTRRPLIQYLDSQIALSDKAKAEHLFQQSPPALRRLQNQSLENLRTLTRVYKERQALPCPPAP